MSQPVPFGPYLLERRLAAGGMGEIFSARLQGPREFEKRIAVKRLHQHLAGDAHMVEMFVAEARLLASLDHPNLVKVFDLIEVGGDFCIVMELLEGQDLAAVLQRATIEKKQIPSEMSAHLIAKACEAVGFAHRLRDADGTSLNVVHRDISPMNILLTWQGDLKVLDFGIAKYARSPVTRAGALKGTFAYMSPEQARGERLDARTDLFAMGLLFLELLLSRRLYRGSDAADAMVTILRERGRMRAVPAEVDDPRVPAGLRPIVSKMLQPNAADRYESADAVIEDLEAYLDRHDRPFSPAVAHLLAGLFDRDDAPAADDPTAIVGYSALEAPGRFSDPASPVTLDSSVSFYSVHDGSDDDWPGLSASGSPAAPRTAFDRLRASRWGTALASPQRRLASGVAAIVAIGLAVGLIWVLPRRQSPAPGPLVATTTVVPKTARLRLATEPPDIRVSIPELDIDGMTPLDRDALPPGHYIAYIHAEGFEPDRIEVELTGDTQADYVVHLRAIAGDGQPAGGGTPLDPVADGENQPATADPAGDGQAGDAGVGEEPGTERDPPGPRQQPGATGSFVVTATPRCDVYDAKGKKLGTTPLNRRRWPVGRHQLTLVNAAEGVRRTMNIRVEANEVEQVQLKLRKGKVRLQVSPWAYIYLGKTRRGQAPGEIELYEGSHVLTLKNPELGKETSVRVTVKPGTTVRMVATLE